MKMTINPPVIRQFSKLYHIEMTLEYFKVKTTKEQPIRFSGVRDLHITAYVLHLHLGCSPFLSRPLANPVMVLSTINSSLILLPLRL
ncbi:hypothetical protein AHAS_Ahas09G0188400 [Arachis hypogaea]